MAERNSLAALVAGYEKFTNGIFLLITVVMSLIPLALAVTAVYSIFTPLYAGEPVSAALLRAIGYLIVAVAVFDVAKFLLEEQVIRGSELRSSAEARRSLTKFMTIMIIAFSLEALVIVFETQEGDHEARLLGPVLLFSAATLAMVGLAVFQWLSRYAEEDEPPVKGNTEAAAENADATASGSGAARD